MNFITRHTDAENWTVNLVGEDGAEYPHQRCTNGVIECYFQGRWHGPACTEENPVLELTRRALIRLRNPALDGTVVIDAGNGITITVAKP